MVAPSIPRPVTEPAPPREPVEAVEVVEAPTLLQPDPRFPVVPSCYSARTVRRAGQLLVLVVVLTVLELAAFGATYQFHTRFYVSTDNAQVDADRIEVNAPAAGLVARWNLEQGAPLRKGEVLGQVRGVGGGRQPGRLIRAPGDGTVELTTIADKTYVQPGQTLAVGINLGQVWITARIAESDIGRVAIGDPAYVRLDAYPGTVVTGVVTRIRGATSAESDIYPSTDLDPTNPQKIDQYVPVRIAPYPSGVPLYPGLNATVEIRTTQ
ncbi:MAG TPA: efflux RND transporter periplasmic adaptor subunit [Pseudonocardia sp.]|jgi:multidrug resistance efflux pump|nr:efflux RND transporter periplasmic adaptor subunit [Pseudonocardia sp.]